MMRLKRWISEEKARLVLPKDDPKPEPIEPPKEKHWCDRYKNTIRFPTGYGVMMYVMCLECGKTHREGATAEGVYMSSIPFSEWKKAKDRWDAGQPEREERHRKSVEARRIDKEASIAWLKKHHETTVIDCPSSNGTKT